MIVEKVHKIFFSHKNAGWRNTQILVFKKSYLENELESELLRFVVVFFFGKTLEDKRDRIKLDFM